MRSRLTTLVVAVAFALVGLTVPPAVTATGPTLTQPIAKMRDATSCQPKAALRSARGVVLLVHGTGEKASETWSWSYQPALRADGFATCTVQLPDHGLGDLTVAAEYVVMAIRKTARRAGGPIAVVGHSQGGALPVWAVKFWPGLADKVTDVVSGRAPATSPPCATPRSPAARRSPPSRHSTTRSCGRSPTRHGSTRRAT